MPSLFFCKISSTKVSKNSIFTEKDLFVFFGGYMRKSLVFYLFVVAITLIFAYALVARDEHPPSIFDQNTWSSWPSTLERDLWNLLATPR